MGEAYIDSRDFFGILLNHLGLVNHPAVEIGVYRGDFAAQILATWAGKKLFLVDCWEDIQPEYTEARHFDFLGPDIQRLNYKYTTERFKEDTRVEIIKATSRIAAERFQVSTFDFIYIDAGHSYKEVMSDLTAWWPKLRTGGVIAGHDYNNASKGDVHYGVKKAVDEFFNGFEVLSTHEVSHPAAADSWYVINKGI